MSALNPPTPRVVVEEHHLAVLLAHCRRERPEEACGLLAGVGDRVRRVIPLTNVAPDRERRYLVDPAEQFAAFRQMRESGEELVAIYHSHPATPAYPSLTDVDLAFYPDAYYVIVSLQQDEPEVRAFRIHRPTRRIEEAFVQVEKGDGPRDGSAG